MSDDLGICQRCQKKPAEAVLKIGGQVMEDGRYGYGSDRRLCMECIEIERWEKPKDGRPVPGRYH